jgi:starch synthase
MLPVAQLVDQLYQRLVYERAEETLQGEERAAKRAERKVMMKADAAKQRRSAQQQFLYTIPLTPRAGQEVEVFYNPDLTVLRGRPEIYLRGCWNRWGPAGGPPHCACLNA